MLLTANQIKQSLLLNFPREETNYSAVPEVAVSNSVSDVFLVNGNIHIFEIKSCKDNLKRLDSQIKSYISCSNYTTLVVGSIFYEKYSKELLLYKKHGVGLRKMSSNGDIETIFNAEKRGVSREKYLDYWKVTDLKKFFLGSKNNSTLTKKLAVQMLSLFSTEAIEQVTLTMLIDKYSEEHNQILKLKEVRRRDVEKTAKYKLSINYKNYLKKMKQKRYMYLLLR